MFFFFFKAVYSIFPTDTMICITMTITMKWNYTYGYMFSLGCYFTTQIWLHEWQKSVLAWQSSIANRWENICIVSYKWFHCCIVSLMSFTNMCMWPTFVLQDTVSLITFTNDKRSIWIVVLDLGAFYILSTHMNFSPTRIIHFCQLH